MNQMVAGHVSCCYDIQYNDKAQIWKKQKPPGSMTVWHFMPHRTESPHIRTEWSRLSILTLILHNISSERIINLPLLSFGTECLVFFFFGGGVCPCFVEWWTTLYLPMIIQYTLVLCVSVGEESYIYVETRDEHSPPLYLVSWGGVSLWT